MLDGELKNKIDSLWEIFWSGGLTNPLDVVEQITYLMFIRDLDDKDKDRALSSSMIGAPYQSIFAPEITIGGRTVDFDQIVSSTIKRVKREFRDDNCSHILVLPYNSAEFQNNEESFEEYYDEIEICPESHAAHFKAAIQTRNRNMIDRSDLCVFYVEQDLGGAYQSFQYAIKHKKDIINIPVEINST